MAEGRDKVQQQDVFIVGAARTPIGNLSGVFASLSAPALGAAAIREALARAGVPASAVQELYMGQVLTANVGQAPARQAALAAGLSESVVCTTVGKVCASGAKAIVLAAQSILLGIADVVVAGGQESMSNAPYYLPRVRQGLRLGDGAVVDGLIKDGLWDPYGDAHMGTCAELCAREHGLSREDQDAHAAESFRRARAAAASGLAAREMVAVEVPAMRKGAPAVRVAADESISKPGGDADALRRLPPAFQKAGGVVTAGNASGISDGAAALVLCSAAAVARLGLTPLARLRGWGEAAQAPARFTTAPSLAIPVALRAAGVVQAEIDLYEINEAFSVVVRANEKLLGLDPARVNVFGGAVAMGHPIGASGCRIVVTLLNALSHLDGRLGCAAICNGGGGATALIVERLPAPSQASRL